MPKVYFLMRHSQRHSDLIANAWTLPTLAGLKLMASTANSDCTTAGPSFSRGPLE